MTKLIFFIFKRLLRVICARLADRGPRVWHPSSAFLLAHLIERTSRSTRLFPLAGCVQGVAG